MRRAEKESKAGGGKAKAILLLGGAGWSGTAAGMQGVTAGQGHRGQGLRVRIAHPASGGAATSRVSGIARCCCMRIRKRRGSGCTATLCSRILRRSAELPQYKAFFKALLSLPTASSLEQYVPKKRINLTLIPVKENDPPDDEEEAAGYVLQHYDYARSAVLAGVACDQDRTGGRCWSPSCSRSIRRRILIRCWCRT